MISVLEQKELFSGENLKNLVEDCDGLEEIADTSYGLEAYDNTEGYYVHFHDLQKIDYESLFDFRKVNVDKEKFFNLVKLYLDPLLFLMPKKIHFVTSEDEFDEIIEEENYSECHNFFFDEQLGLCMLEESAIIINVYLCEKTAREIDNQYKLDGLSVEINRAIWTTIIHELRHMECDQGYIISEDLIPISEGSEDSVENYCNEVFEKKLQYLDFICFS